MDYEKRYNKLIDAIKEMMEANPHDEGLQNWVQDNVPELTESEDEKIRKQIISFLKEFEYDHYRNLDFSSWIAWLEKQGKLDNSDTDILNRFSFYSYKDEPNVIYLSELYVNKERRNKGIGTKILEIADKVAASMGCNFIRLKTEIDSDAERLYKRNGYKTLNREGNQVWLEKQSKKSVNIDMESMVSSYKQRLESQGNGGMGNNPLVNMCLTAFKHGVEEVLQELNLKEFEKPQGESERIRKVIKEEKVDNANKVKPKFNEGDWIVDNNSGGVYQITEIRDNEYCLWPLDAEIMGYLKIIDVDNDYHLWTIADAKDGDVLAFKDGTSGVLLYKENTENFGVLSYCRIVRNNFIDKEESGWGSTLLSPATKEQRELLFSKMKDEGYWWNAENKELEKNDQNSAWSEADKDFMYDTLSNLTELKDRYGEEYGNVGKCIEWLRTLKDRVQPQPKQEWSEEDELNLKGIIDEIEANKNSAPSYDLPTYDKYLNWLKSLKKKIINEL